VRIAIVTESFLPQVNGVSNTVRHMAQRLRQRGHDLLVVAPGPGEGRYAEVPVLRVPSMDLPRYRSFRLGMPLVSVERHIVAFRPDVVHLASPAILGWAGLRAAERIDVPVVAAYQTDLVGFATQYGLGAHALVGRWVARLHSRANRTLVPSSASMEQLSRLGVPRLQLWRRGVDLTLFDPARRDEALRKRWAGPSSKRLLVGYVGRLAAEKQVRRLAALADVPGIRLVVVGDGPERPWLEQRLPDAVFTGMLHGAVLAKAFASLDVFVHTGEAETFCQTVQEAQACGVPVVAPAAGGPLDLIDPGRTGLLYQPGRSRGLVRQVRTLTDDAGLREHLKANAQEAVSRRTWASVVDELADNHYPAVLSPDRSAALGAA
jgi:phosphatidylinositol alpha 1,6-mannosyltransferase